MNLLTEDELDTNILLNESMLLLVKSSESLIKDTFFHNPSASLGETTT